MSTFIHPLVEAARAGKNPALICRLLSGWVVLYDLQFLRGYSILLADPVAVSINDFDRQSRAQFMCDMALIGDALLEVTGAYRINYAILGNTDPFLHAHIVPRYMTEPEEFRKGPPWSYPQEVIDAVAFNYEENRNLIQQIAEAIQTRL